MHYSILRSDTLTFDWEGLLLRDAGEVPIAGFRRYDGPYAVADFSAEQIDITYAGTVMRLHVGGSGDA